MAQPVTGPPYPIWIQLQDVLLRAGLLLPRDDGLTLVLVRQHGPNQRQVGDRLFQEITKDVISSQ